MRSKKPVRYIILISTLHLWRRSKNQAPWPLGYDLSFMFTSFAAYANSTATQDCVKVSLQHVVNTLSLLYSLISYVEYLNVNVLWLCLTFHDTACFMHTFKSSCSNFACAVYCAFFRPVRYLFLLVSLKKFGDVPFPRKLNCNSKVCTSLSGMLSLQSRTCWQASEIKYYLLTKINSVTIQWKEKKNVSLLFVREPVLSRIWLYLAIIMITQILYLNDCCLQN